MDILLEKEEQFNNAIRDYLIVLLTFFCLFVISYFIIEYFQLKRERDGWYTNDDDAKVYRISLILCTITLVASLSNILLLPMSTLANEVLHIFPNNYWVQWLHSDLVDKMWTYVYFASNISIFALLPFSYFLLESEGFSGNRKGILPRIHETIVVLLLFAVLVFGIVALALAFLDGDNTGLDFVMYVGEYYVQHIYSFLLCCAAFVILTFCAPVGMIKLFDIAGELLVKPRLFGTSDSSIYFLDVQQESLLRKQRQNKHRNNTSNLDDELKEIEAHKERVLREKSSSGWERNVGYPIVMVMLILATIISLFLVVLNILELLFYGSVGHAHMHEKTLGVASLSMLGFFGSVLEVFVQFYIVIATILGFYNLPFLRQFRPIKNGTSMTTVIWNCIFLQLLTSAMPGLSTVLGITDFTLRGSYKDFYWIYNFYIVLVYNLIFAIVAALCLAIKVTTKVKTELYNALGLEKKNAVVPESPKKTIFEDLNHFKDESPLKSKLSDITAEESSKTNNNDNVILLAKSSDETVRCRENANCSRKSIS